MNRCALFLDALYVMTPDHAPFIATNVQNTLRCDQFDHGSEVESVIHLTWQQ